MMSDQATINKEELAALLNTSIGGINQMRFRGELPETAFPNKRKVTWFVGVIRRMLDDRMQEALKIQTFDIPGPENQADSKKIGRPRK